MGINYNWPNDASTEQCWVEYHNVPNAEGENLDSIDSKRHTNVLATWMTL